MQIKLFPIVALVAGLLLISANGAAQSVQISGQVMLRQADGSLIPVEGAYIDIYRTDRKGQYQSKTNKRGYFIHAGLPFDGVYTFAVSAVGAKPTFVSGLRPSEKTKFDFELQPGDGSRLTPEQVTGESGKESNEDEELERKKKEIEESNRKITAANEIIQRTFSAGNAALNAGRLDEAIAQYREGLAARPDEPAILTNLSNALRRRGDERYNAALKSSPSDKAGLDASSKDWRDAAASSAKALESIKTALDSDSSDALQQFHSPTKTLALNNRALALMRIASKVDGAQASAAWEAYQEYSAVVTAPAEKAKFRGEALQMLIEAEATDLAIREARRVLASEPDDLTANRVLGFALFAKGDKQNFQEAADRLQWYVDRASDTDPLKELAKEALNYLVSTGSIKPRDR